MSQRRLLLTGLAAAAFAITSGCNCGGDEPNPPTNTNVELTDFARELIETQTNETAQPVEIADRELVDSEDPNAFVPEFFQL